MPWLPSSPLAGRLLKPWTFRRRLFTVHPISVELIPTWQCSRYSEGNNAEIITNSRNSIASDHYKLFEHWSTSNFYVSWIGTDGLPTSKSWIADSFSKNLSGFQKGKSVCFLDWNSLNNNKWLINLTKPAVQVRYPSAQHKLQETGKDQKRFTFCTPFVVCIT